MSSTPKTLSQMVEEITQAKRDQEAEWKRLAAADQQLQGLTLWAIPDLVEALTHGRVHIAPGHDPSLTAPTSAQEALDLAWELAHEVKEGQTIPGRKRTIGRYEDGDFFLGMSLTDRLVTGSEESHLRTLDPLPDPEPDWLDAPAVLAECEKCSPGKQAVHVNYSEIAWTCTDCDNPINPEDMKNVTPLYPKEQGAVPADIPDEPLRRRAYLFHYGKPWGTRLGGDPA